jgi:toxin FitB
MIVLDTNVVSELMRLQPNESVVGWINAQVATSLCVTAITQAEILHGIRLLPKGKRRDAIAAARRGMGRPIAAFDAQIAAIARTNDARLATRNVANFAGCGINVINPWKA